MGNISSCCLPENPRDAPESSSLHRSLTTEQDIPYLQARRPIYRESSEPSLESEFHSAPSSVSPVIKRIPGRPSTPRVDEETGESSNADSLEFGSENNFRTPTSFISVSDTPSESGVENAVISVHPAKPTYHSEERARYSSEILTSTNISSGIGSLKEDSSFDSTKDARFPEFPSSETRKDGPERRESESSTVVFSEGGSLRVKGVELCWPPGALDDPETIKLTLEDPCKHYSLIFQNKLENDLIFGSNIINLRPNGLKFNKFLTLRITLDKNKGPHNEWLVLHGKQALDGNIFWENITDHTRFDLINEVVTTEINGFSIIAVLLRSIWVRSKEIVTRLNLMSFKYTLSVLYRCNLQNCPFEELALVFMSKDVYQEQSYREHDECALEKLKRDGFEELGSNVRQETNYIYDKERLVVSILLGKDYKLANNQRESIEVTVESSVWWSTGKSVTFLLQSLCTKAKILCGEINIEGQYGHTRKDNFCQSDLSCYLKRLLGVGELAFNLRPISIRLELPTETWSQAVSWCQKEDKQLETLLQGWKVQQGDEASPELLRKSLDGLKAEEFRVKERGQMHITHLRELANSIHGLNHEDHDMIKYLENEIRNLCRSILRDCCIEMANSTEEMKWASSIENHTDVLVTQGILSDEVSQQCKAMCSSADNVVKTSFLVLVPHLVQAVKEIFRDESVLPSQSGMRGLGEETVTRIVSAIQNAAKDKKILSLFRQVCDILEMLCLDNNDNPSQNTDEKIQEWGRSVMVITMLDALEVFFETAGSDARRLRERLRVASLHLKDIISDQKAYEGIFLRDFHNVSLNLLKFARFDPSQLVRFELIDPNVSSNTQWNDPLKYQMFSSKGIRFAQVFWINKESEGDLQLEAVAHVHIDGHLRKIGAFESAITIPQACSEVVDNLQYASMPVAVERNYGFWGKIRVILYSSQKENVMKALEYLRQELGEEVVDLNKEKIAPSHLKIRSFAKAGKVVKLRLIHKWGSETVGLESNDFIALADSSVGGAYMPDAETAAEANKMMVQPTTGDAKANSSDVRSFVTDSSHTEVIQRHQKEQRGKTEIHYHQTFMKGHVCVAGKNTSLNM